MSARSLNKVILIGNLTRDPELRYTPAGTAVCTFGLATNRQWTTQSGETKEDTEFHRIVSWNKLAELCSQLLAKGRKVYVEGRLATHTWTGQDGLQRTTTEIVIDDMIILDSKKFVREEGAVPVQPEEKAVSVGEVEVAFPDESTPSVPSASSLPPSVSDSKKPKKKGKASKEEEKEEEGKTESKEEGNETITPDDIPF